MKYIILICTFFALSSFSIAKPEIKENAESYIKRLKNHKHKVTVFCRADEDTKNLIIGYVNRELKSLDNIEVIEQPSKAYAKYNLFVTCVRHEDEKAYSIYFEVKQPWEEEIGLQIDLDEEEYKKIEKRAQSWYYTYSKLDFGILKIVPAEQLEDYCKDIVKQFDEKLIAPLRYFNKELIKEIEKSKVK